MIRVIAFIVHFISVTFTAAPSQIIRHQIAELGDPCYKRCYACGRGLQGLAWNPGSAPTVVSPWVDDLTPLYLTLLIHGQGMMWACVLIGLQGQAHLARLSVSRVVGRAITA